MIPPQTNTKEVTTGAILSGKMRISTDPGDQLAMVLVMRSGIYSDPHLAVLRELISNGIDAQVMAGNVTGRVRVDLPCGGNQELVIRDFGPGLSVDDVINVYFVMGASKKREVADAHGFMGIGSKSPLAVCDVLHVVSHHNGMKRVFVCAVNEKDTNVHLVAETPCDTTGMEIRIPCKSGDAEKYRAALSYLLGYGLNERVDVYAGDDLLTFPLRPFVHKNPHGGFINAGEGDGDIVVMGGVPYKADLSKLSSSPRKNHHHSVLFANIGDMDIVASREDIRDTERTRNAMAEKLAECRMYALSTIHELVGGEKNLDARCAARFASDLFPQEAETAMKVAGIAAIFPDSARAHVRHTFSGAAGEGCVTVYDTNQRVHDRQGFTAWKPSIKAYVVAAKSRIGPAFRDVLLTSGETAAVLLRLTGVTKKNGDSTETQELVAAAIDSAQLKGITVVGYCETQGLCRTAVRNTTRKAANGKRYPKGYYKCVRQKHAHNLHTMAFKGVDTWFTGPVIYTAIKEENVGTARSAWRTATRVIADMSTLVPAMRLACTNVPVVAMKDTAVKMVCEANPLAISLDDLVKKYVGVARQSPMVSDVLFCSSVQYGGFNFPASTRKVLLTRLGVGHHMAPYLRPDVPEVSMTTIAYLADTDSDMPRLSHIRNWVACLNRYLSDCYPLLANRTDGDVEHVANYILACDAGII